MRQDKGKEMDHEGKVASQRNERKTFTPPRFIWSGYSSWSPLRDQQRKIFNSKKQNLSGQTTFRKQKIDRNYMKLLALANKIPAFRETTHRRLNSSFPKAEVHQCYWNEDMCWNGRTEENLWLLCKTWSQQSPARSKQNLSVGQRKSLVNWEGLLQCLSQQIRGLGTGEVSNGV